LRYRLSADLDEFEMRRCRREVEELASQVESAKICIDSEARLAKSEADAAVNDAIRRFNCYARGGIGCR
jgi:hypothetical protein